MMLPTDNVLYANLSTGFADLDNLIGELGEAGHTGYVRLRFPGYEGVVVLYEGAIVRSVGREDDGEPCPATVGSIAARARSRGGQIDVFHLAPGFAGLLATMAHTTPVYRDLTTIFANPDRLLGMLRDRKHTGFVDVALEGGHGAGAIYLADGVVVEATLQDGDQWSTGSDVADMVVQSAANYGAVFSVYRAVDAPVAAEPAPIAVIEPPKPQLEIVPPTAPLLEPAGGEGTEPEGEASPAAVHAAPPPPAINKTDLLNFWSEVLTRAEVVVDAISSSGRFLTAFKEVLVEKAHEYPYLDPFAADFAYADGMVTFGGELPADLSEALGDCLHDTLARLAFRLRRSDIETRVHASLADLGERYTETVSHFSPSTQSLVS